MLAGCAVFERDPDDYDGRALPWSVGVWFDGRQSEISPEVPEEGEAFAAGFRATGADVAAWVAERLERGEIVSRAAVLEAASVDEALEKARPHDFLLALDLRAPEDYGDAERSWGWGTLEVVSWLFGGVPSWFVPSVSWAGRTELVLVLADLNDLRDGRPALERDTLGVDRSATSLWERSDLREDPGDYALSIVIPPMAIVPGGVAEQGEIATASVLDDLGDLLEGEYKERLVEHELSRPLRIAFLNPEPGGTPGEPAPALRLEIVSQGAVPIRALDVHRHVAGQTSWRWVAGPEQLRAINDGLQGGSSVRFRFELPQGLPLAPGINVIKVRAQRDDGERLTRTVVYEYEER